MCYKDEVQRKYLENLQRRFEKDKVPEFIRRYFINIRSKCGAVNYWIAIRDCLIWLFENKTIDKLKISDITINDFFDVEPEDITLYLEQKEQDGMSPTTLETRKNIIRSFWGYLARQKGSTINAKDFFCNVSYRGISSKDNLSNKMPTDKQLTDMEEKIGRKKDIYVKIRNLAVFEMLKGTGLRESEIAGLDLTDLYFEEEIPYIMTIRKGSYREREAQKVYLTGNACAAIKEWLRIRENLGNIIDKNALFLNRNGKRFTEDNIQSMFKTYGNGVTPHMIRHFYATIMASSGNLAFVQQQLGHTSSNTTVNNYIDGVYGMKDILSNM